MPGHEEGLAAIHEYEHHLNNSIELYKDMIRVGKKPPPVMNLVDQSIV